MTSCAARHAVAVTSGGGDSMHSHSDEASRTERHLAGHGVDCNQLAR